MKYLHVESYQGEVLQPEGGQQTRFMGEMELSSLLTQK